MIKKSGAVRKWLAAFILSPGMIFTQAYLLVWLGANLYLDHAFKRHLQQLLSSETGGRYTLEVQEVQASAWLNAIILKKIELSPLDATENHRAETGRRQITELTIDWPDMCYLPFRPSDERSSMQKITRQILKHAAQ